MKILGLQEFKQKYLLSSFFLFYFNKDPDRNTPLHVALKKGNWVIISLLMEHIKHGTIFNIRNGKDLYPYQCADNPAIRDLFYRTYVVNSQSKAQTDSVGISSLSNKLQSGCDQYRKMMLEKLVEAQKRCEKEKEQILQSSSFKNMICICEKCQHHQSKQCGRIAKYACKDCKFLLFCEKCVEFNKCINCNKENNFIRVQQIPFDYNYPNFENFIHEKKQDNEQEP